jgi:hypothetical protein
MRSSRISKAHGMTSRAIESRSHEETEELHEELHEEVGAAEHGP